MQILGVDFTSAPSRRKPITAASGRFKQKVFCLERIEVLASFDAFEALLIRPGPWVGGFDFPFGLPRELLISLHWLPEGGSGVSPWASVTRHLQQMARPQMVDVFRGWCKARPIGSKFAHRATDLVAGSSSSMKWVNPPVAFMLQAGAPRLLSAGVSIPGLHAGDPARIALEAYPGMSARAIVGRRSYKSDAVAKQTPEREQARREIVEALESGQPLGVPIALAPELRVQCIADPSGDSLDAVICAIQAAWAWQRRDAGFGLPSEIDPLEGWIIAAEHTV